MKKSIKKFLAMTLTLSFISQTLITSGAEPDIIPEEDVIYEEITSDSDSYEAENIKNETDNEEEIYADEPIEEYTDGSINITLSDLENHNIDVSSNDITFNESTGYIPFDMPKPIITEKKRNKESLEKTLPSYYNAFDEGYLTPTKNQNPTGTCWAHAIIEAIESYIIKNNIEIDIDGDGDLDAPTNENLKLSPLYLAYSVYQLYDDGDESKAGLSGYVPEATSNKPDYTQVGGNVLRALSDLRQWHGIQLESKFPISKYADYIKNDYSMENFTSFKKADNLGIHMTGYEIINTYKEFQSFNDYLDTLEKTKEKLIEYGTGTISYTASTPNRPTYKDKTVYTIYTSSSTDSNHAVQLVGYDDEIPAIMFTDAQGNHPSAPGAWICRQSYGPSGPYNDMNGLFYISYMDKSATNLSFIQVEHENPDESENFGYLGTTSSAIGYTYNRSGINAELYSTFTNNNDKCLVIDSVSFENWGYPYKARAFVTVLNEEETVYNEDNIKKTRTKPDDKSLIASTEEYTADTGFSMVKKELDGPVIIRPGRQYQIKYSLEFDDKIIIPMSKTVKSADGPTLEEGAYDAITENWISSDIKFNQYDNEWESSKMIKNYGANAYMTVDGTTYACTDNMPIRAYGYYTDDDLPDVSDKLRATISYPEIPSVIAKKLYEDTNNYNEGYLLEMYDEKSQSFKKIPEEYYDYKISNKTDENSAGSIHTVEFTINDDGMDVLGIQGTATVAYKLTQPSMNDITVTYPKTYYDKTRTTPVMPESVIYSKLGYEIPLTKDDYELTVPENTDYNAGNKYFILKGKNNFEGELTTICKIEPLDLNDTDLTINIPSTPDIITISNNIIKIYSDGILLKGGTDYVFANGNEHIMTDTANIQINGINNYTGKYNFNYSIQPVSLNDPKITVSFINCPTTYVPALKTSDFTLMLKYDGKEIDPSLYKYEIDENSDAIKYDNRIKTINAGTLKIDIMPESTSYGPYVKDTKTINVEIQPESIKNVVISINQLKEYVYEMPIEYLISHAQHRMAMLTYGKDFIAEPETVKNADEFKFKIKGIGNYNDEKEYTMNIAPQTVSSANIEKIQDVYYNPNMSSYEEPVIKDKNDHLLVKDTDYDVTYDTKNNDYSVGTVNVSITCKGNYTGNIKTDYNILPQHIENGIVSINGQNTVNSVTVNKNVLTKNKDYDIDYNQKTDSIIITITGKGNYTGTITRTINTKDDSSSGKTSSSSNKDDSSSDKNSSSSEKTSSSSSAMTNERKSLEDAQITIDRYGMVTIIYDDDVLTEELDYTLTYAKNRNGMYYVIIKGIGNYKGTIYKYFSSKQQREEEKKSSSSSSVKNDSSSSVKDDSSSSKKDSSSSSKKDDSSSSRKNSSSSSERKDDSSSSIKDDDSSSKKDDNSSSIKDDSSSSAKQDGNDETDDNAVSENIIQIKMRIGKTDATVIIINSNTEKIFKPSKNGKKIKLLKLKKEGYKFKCWYVNGKKAKYITEKDIKDGIIEIKAEFVPIKYKVIYKMTKPKKCKEKVKKSIKKQTATYDESFEIKSKPELEGYTFLGWSKEKNNGIVDYIPGEITKNLTSKKKIVLYPVWQKN